MQIDGRLELKKIARCEDCTARKTFRDWPKGWSQCGTSRFGIMYQRSGIAWHCPKHSRMNEPQKERTGGK